MLVLTRKYQEKIRIGENVTITVLRTKGKAVRLGIEAPADVPVIRGELSFEDPVATGEEASVITVESRKRPVCTGGTSSTAHWAADSNPNNLGCTVSRESEAKVALSRVPRGKVAALLPTLVNGNGPLRAVMDQRVST